MHDAATIPTGRRSLPSVATVVAASLSKEVGSDSGAMESQDLDALMYRLGALGCPKVRAPDRIDLPVNNDP